MSPCSSERAALTDCKKALGLLPLQCYPHTGYKGTCDSFEFNLKKCRANNVDPRDARTLYDPNARREDRVAANARLQKRLKDQPCTP